MSEKETNPSTTETTPTSVTSDKEVVEAEKVTEAAPVVAETTVTEVVAEATGTPEVVTSESVVTEAEPTTKKSIMCRIEEKCPRFKWVLAAIAIVAFTLLSVLYRLEREGRSSTHLFTGLIERQENNRVVAIVNGEDIINADLKISVEQFSQMAAAQGVDTTSAKSQSELRNQALEVLINTTLLKQEAVTRAVTVTDEEVGSRIDAIREEVGGAEVLAERMESLGLTEEKLRADVKDELTIQKLLDQVFEEANIQITEEEVASVYEGAGGAGAGLPALEEVRAQVEAQIKASKEQAAIDDFLTKLKEKAKIETK
ncbi:MAG: SurA N-terminal domain-containing protein [Candidatus Pacebacteria bacterium]|nr:SurA N-terminal domain-containing protein [Candidatus Paceibacterota bacterium]